MMTMELKPAKLFLIFSFIVLLCAACASGDLLPVPASEQPVSTLILIPTETPLPTFTSTPQPTQTPIALPPVQTLEPPDWVIDFSDPILAAINYRRPDYLEEFKLPNKGWFYFVPGSRRNPYYADLTNEVLNVKLPAENEKKDVWAYSPLIHRKNFVLSFDFQFEATQPKDTVRFQFDQTKTESIALDLAKDLTWTLHYGERVDWQSITGKYEYFPPEKISVLFILQGVDCAVYLKDAPLAYLKDCRVKPSVRSVPWAVTFHVLAEPGHTAAFTIDNLKLWDLDKVPGLSGK
jgi:hypothetical protein